MPSTARTALFRSVRQGDVALTPPAFLIKEARIQMLEAVSEGFLIPLQFKGYVAPILSIQNVAGDSNEPKFGSELHRRFLLMREATENTAVYKSSHFMRKLSDELRAITNEKDYIEAAERLYQQSFGTAFPAVERQVIKNAARSRRVHQEAIESGKSLKYNTQRDERVRPTHRVLEGLTLPANHPLWGSLMPPLGYNCRCYVITVSGRRTILPIEELPEVEAGFGRWLDNDRPLPITSPYYEGAGSLYGNFPVVRKERVDHNFRLYKELTEQGTPITTDIATGGFSYAIGPGGNKTFAKTLREKGFAVGTYKDHLVVEGLTYKIYNAKSIAEVIALTSDRAITTPLFINYEGTIDNALLAFFLLIAATLAVILIDKEDTVLKVPESYEPTN